MAEENTDFDLEETTKTKVQQDPTVTGELITEDPQEITGTEGITLGTDKAFTAGQVGTTDLDITTPTAPEDLGKIDEIEKVGTVTDAEYAAGTPTKEIGEIKGVVSDKSQAVAATQELDERATIKYQLGELMKGVTEDTELPAWASPAVRKVGAIMAQRGLGASSMASAAMVQAIMEAGVPIASADAQSYARIQLQNLNNEQTTALQNATVYANMDAADLNARLTAAVNNAKNFLTMDLQNLTNEQASNTLTYQAKTNKLFTDAAAENLRLQINAKTQVQVEEFYDELGAQVGAANKNRKASMEQFNVSEENAMLQFQETTIDSREKFNANMGYAVDQSNVQWRRQINTANTTIQNETNRVNAQMMYNATQQAMNFLWQKYRDNATFNFQKIENAFGREHAIGLMALEYSYNKQLLDEEQKKGILKSIGSFIRSWNEET